MKTTTRVHESTAPGSIPSITLLLAFELGERTWKLGFTTGLGQRPRIRQVPAGAVDRVLEEIARAKRRLKLPVDTPVISCDEAGRDGFWLHRYLVAHGVTNSVVDSSSIEVKRRARRAKTDNLDLAGLLTLLARYLAGDRRAWHVVRVPSVADEDARQLHRTWETVQQDRTRLIRSSWCSATSRAISGSWTCSARGRVGRPVGRLCGPAKAGPYVRPLRTVGAG